MNARSTKAAAPAPASADPTAPLRPDMPERARNASETATERVYQAIYQAVLEHRLEPGERLREAELAQGLGVSRTVVRQALQRLAQDQVVELMHNRGARVTLPRLEDARHVFEARRVVECEVARRLGGRLDEAQIAQLKSLVQAEAQAERHGERAELIRLSGEFHQALAAMHGNPVFIRLLGSLLPTTSLLMARFKQQGVQLCEGHRHIDLIAALQRGPAPAAGEMRRHLDELEQSLSRPETPRRPLRDLFAAYRAPSGSVPGDTEPTT